MKEDEERENASEEAEEDTNGKTWRGDSCMQDVLGRVCGSGDRRWRRRAPVYRHTHHREPAVH